MTSLLTASLLVSGIGAVAQTPNSSPKKPESELRTVNQVIGQVCTFLESQKSFSVVMDITYDDVLTTGEKVQYSAYQKLWVEKPNRMRSYYVGDQRITNFYYDGKTFTLESPELNHYATKAAPETLDAVLDQVDQNYGITIPMSNLVATKTCADMMSDVWRTQFVGVDMVNRVPMYHILLSGKERDYQMWVTKDKQPLLRKAIISYKNLPGSPQYTVLLSHWNFNPKTPDRVFTFTPPKDAVKIEFLPPTDASVVIEKPAK
ncbi:MAG TPA: DUF2092 domain-containing protein [Leptolyngbyaceae cyanobacterium M33_DOE_097]|uniref:DUF2092 domain-containing protein n=1 Tax=Oscillatoriales cyanobacterium SpSt-418 TaxID=2282169 RepID=A0A7C3KI41_9CYAN|nr:DUF2092 domain-containing protein [Leptolyngbyaceae cyanobacterium M33_DOE_097]